MIFNKDTLKVGSLINISFPNEKKYKQIKEHDDGFGIISSMTELDFSARMLTGNSKGKIRQYAFVETEFYPEAFTEQNDND